MGGNTVTVNVEPKQKGRPGAAFPLIQKRGDQIE
jgi:hypothetical protein